MRLLDTITEFDHCISSAFQERSIKVMSFATANGPLQDSPLEFEFLTRTKVDVHTREAYTHILRIQGFIPDAISLGHPYESLSIIPQKVSIECNYKLLHLDKKDMQQILQHPQPDQHYGEWLIDAIKNANILVELKTNQHTYTEWPIGIKSASLL
ncbi:hypothetical protein MHB44_15775 [Lysinibacillus sp. FSL H8-0500]|uniref:hypothetical protein n=1 Tax=Lysinibacillus sp. FSL H8-0500 TaxID=2921393 RepID=UPI0031015223